MNKLSVHLVTWNGEKYIPYLFESLKKQTFSDWNLVILDNGSSDGTVETLKKEIDKWKLVSSNFEIQFIEKKENFGFAGGHNFLFTNYQLPITNYFLLLNQDMYLGENCFEKMVKFLDEHGDVSSVSPRLMRWDFGKIQDSRLAGRPARFEIQDSLTNKIDTLGLKVFRNRRIIEKYAGKEWDDKKSKVELSFRTEGEAMEVFGVSGALPMYRRSSIESVRFGDGTFFDGLYHLYKEDVDLAFRLRIAGYKSFVLLDTLAYHDRSAEGLEKMNDSAAAENKKKQSQWVKYHSYKNHLMTIYKNEYWQNFLLDAVFIKWYELKKFGWFLLFEREVLKGLGEIWKNRKELKIKRQEVKEMRKVNWREIRKWWK